MGRGDKKTKKGKIWKGTYGNSRKRKVNKNTFRYAGIDGGEVSEPKAILKEESAIKPKVTPKSDAMPTSEAVVASGLETVSKATAKPKVKATAEPKVKATAKPKVKATAKPKVKATAKPKVKATAKPKVKATAKPKVKATAKPKVKATAKPKPKVKATAKPKT